MPEATHTFHAFNLLYTYGFDDGATPDEVKGAWFDRLDAEVAAGAAPAADLSVHDGWETDVLVPVVRHLLVPAVDADLEVYTIASHNPIRVDTVNGQPVDDRQPIPDEIRSPFDDVAVTLPVTLLVQAMFREPVLTGLERLSGLDLTLVSHAFAAGLSVDEIAAHRAAGTLTADAVRTLAALRAPHSAPGV